SWRELAPVGSVSRLPHAPIPFTGVAFARAARSWEKTRPSTSHHTKRHGSRAYVDEPDTPGQCACKVGMIVLTAPLAKRWGRGAPRARCWIVSVAGVPNVVNVATMSARSRSERSSVLANT